MRPEVNSNRFEISIRGKISLRCEVTSVKFHFGRSETHFGANFTSVNFFLCVGTEPHHRRKCRGGYLSGKKELYTR